MSFSLSIYSYLFSYFLISDSGIILIRIFFSFWLNKGILGNSTLFLLSFSFSVLSPWFLTFCAKAILLLKFCFFWIISNVCWSIYFNFLLLFLFFGSLFPSSLASVFNNLSFFFLYLSIFSSIICFLFSSFCSSFKSLYKSELLFVFIIKLISFLSILLFSLTFNLRSASSFCKILISSLILDFSSSHFICSSCNCSKYPFSFCNSSNLFFEIFILLFKSFICSIFTLESNSFCNFSFFFL